LQWNQILTNGCTHIADSLTTNTSLKDIQISISCKQGLAGLIMNLPRMNRLKRLYPRVFDDCFTATGARSFVTAIEQNTSLENINLVRYTEHALAADIMANVKSIMTLNGAGRRILVSPQATVPISLWPCILAKSSSNPDVLSFSFVRIRHC
jgi:hypothetical protein